MIHHKQNLEFETFKVQKMFFNRDLKLFGLIVLCIACWRMEEKCVVSHRMENIVKIHLRVVSILEYNSKSITNMKIFVYVLDFESQDNSIIYSPLDFASLRIGPNLFISNIYGRTLCYFSNLKPKDLVTSY